MKELQLSFLSFGHEDLGRLFTDGQSSFLVPRNNGASVSVRMQVEANCIGP